MDSNMKKIIIAFLLVVITAGMFFPMAFADENVALAYTVSTKQVILSEDGTGSFSITIPEVTAYAGVQYAVQLPSGVEITSIEYSGSEPSVTGPLSPQKDSAGVSYFSTGMATTNKYKGSLKCTINVTYTANTGANITIEEVKMYVLKEDHKVDSYISKESATVKLAPFGSSAGDTDNPVTGEPGGVSIGDITDPDNPLVAAFPFTDVKMGDWFYKDVLYMWANSLMNGTEETLFSPNGLVTRGMVVTVLYRMEGAPDVSGSTNPFDDVASGVYYTDAIKWGAEHDIIRGYGDGRFGPGDNVTREQLATILFRYQQYADNIPPDIAESREFADRSNISDYAKEAVNKLVMQGIINGKPDNKFDPKGNATRAEFAAMLHRFLDR